MKITEQVRKAIRDCDFDKAYSTMEYLSITEKVDLLFNRISLFNNVNMYLFLLYLISKGKDTAELNFRCFIYLVFESSLFNDSMCLAAWHARNALSLDEGNIEYIKAIFSVFAGYSEQFFTREEFNRMAETLVRTCPDCNEALEYLAK